MIEKIFASIRKRRQNPILMVIVVLLYVSNNLVFKNVTDGKLCYFFVCYFNDLICPLFFFSYMNALLLTVQKELIRLWQILLIGIGASLIWEWAAPFLKESAVADPMDVLCYLLGSMLYWSIMYVSQKKNPHFVTQ